MRGFDLIFTIFFSALTSYAIGWKLEILFMEKSCGYSKNIKGLLINRYERGEISKEELQ